MSKVSKFESPSKSAKSTDIPFQDSTGVSCDDSGPQNRPLLNIDIIYLVMEHAYYNDMFLPDFKQLSRCALVARAWRKPAQSLLFHEVALRDVPAYVSLSSLFEGQKSEHVQWLANCVRVLDFWITRVRRGSITTWERRLPLAMNWFPLLYELRLGVDVVDRLSESTMVLLNSTPPIRALQIAMRCDERFDAIKCVLPFQMLTVKAWNLGLLVIRGGMFNLAGHVAFPPVRHKLVEFRWTVPNAVTDTLAEGLITYVTANSLKTLEVLHIPTASHPVVAKVAPALRCFKVTSSVGVPTRLSDLKKLIIADPFFNHLDTWFYSTLHVEQIGWRVEGVRVGGLYRIMRLDYQTDYVDR